MKESKENNVINFFEKLNEKREENARKTLTNSEDGAFFINLFDAMDSTEHIEEDSKKALGQSILDAIARQNMYENMMDEREIRYNEMGISPRQCFNLVCRDNKDERCVNDRRPIDCSFRMTHMPPNDFNYNESYIPSHAEALNMLEMHGLISGEREEYLKASLYYLKAHIDDRDSTMYYISMSTITHAIKDEIKRYNKQLKDEGLFLPEDTISPELISRNVGIAIEELTGVMPNISFDKEAHKGIIPSVIETSSKDLVKKILKELINEDKQTREAEHSEDV